MIRIQSFQDPEGPALYLIPTPIGNLSEISERAKKSLEEVDVLFCEDTRVTRKLLSHLNLSKTLYSHHEHNAKSSAEKMLELLKEGKKIGLVSDAGYPLISDPGAQIVSLCLENSIPVIPVSGPNAALNALVASGMDLQHFLYYGFLNSRSSARKKELKELEQIPWPLVFYEAPHRLKEMLADVLEILGDRKIVVARELSKIHEEFIHGTAAEILEIADELKGEMVVIVSGYQRDEKKILLQALKELEKRKSAGEKARAACKDLALKYGLSKNELYQYWLEDKEKD